jgi:hypothetical protein
MWGYLIVGGIAALVTSARGPKTRITKSVVVGPRSGQKWQTEYLEDLQVLVVMSGSTRVAFRRSPGGWQMARAVGNPQVVEVIKGDFENGNH